MQEQHQRAVGWSKRQANRGDACLNSCSSGHGNCVSPSTRTGGPFNSSSSSGHDRAKGGFGIVRRVLKKDASSVVSPNGCSHSDLSTSGCWAAPAHGDPQTSRPQTQQLSETRPTRSDRQGRCRAEPSAYCAVKTLWAHTNSTRRRTNLYVFDNRNRLLVKEIHKCFLEEKT